MIHTPLPRTLRLLHAGIEQGLHPAAQLCIWHRGEVLADVAVGEGLSPDHLLPWHSAGKPITAVAALQLVECGKLDLDTPVAHWLPDFAAGGKAQITPRHILTHTAGFRGLRSSLPHGASYAEALRDISAMELEPDWHIGHTAGYHPLTSWFILGEVVQRAADQPLQDYVREHIFEPLGMVDAWLSMPPDVYQTYQDADRIAPTFDTARPTSTPQPLSPSAPSTFKPGGGAIGPAHDLARFYEALRRGGELDDARILRSDTVDIMSHRHRTGSVDRTFGVAMDWGLGVILEPLTRNARYPYGYGRHASSATFGHGGVRSVAAFADPEHHLTVALAYTGQPAERDHQRRIDDTLTAIYSDLHLAPREELKPQINTDEHR